MHDKVLVRVTVEAKDKSIEQIKADAKHLAMENLDTYEGVYYDYYDMDRDSIDDYLTFDGGKVGSMCRVSEFEKFTHDNDLPMYIVDGAILDRQLFKHYGVRWEDVVEEHLSSVKSIDNGSEYQLWFVTADAHV